MSSTFSFLCLGHDPAIETSRLIHGSRDVRDEATALSLLPEHRAEHPRCDLLLARYSGGLVELICPPSLEVGETRHGGSYHPHGPDRVDAKWLRLLWAACSYPTPRELVLQNTVDAFNATCWNWARLSRLGYVLGVQDYPGTELP
ncbi:hypothetical protein [Lentzea cavernae]|uniref:Uncharacterized protein n=1 Tax=Lentzea cavernae TaxID=2020703 RepID=A0ABQ3MT07_9PSEU|nr:hypothetical protein [Lentzea cavernae]GHH57772.1 hypothetical protein GCM10017774_78010 [Lentzea cavernae]